MEAAMSSSGVLVAVIWGSGVDLMRSYSQVAVLWIFVGEEVELVMAVMRN
jgi:hypothetical protein